MNPTALPPPPPGVKRVAEAVRCYNCGSSLHYFSACPEPTRNPPFGLEAARAKGMAGGQGQQNGFKRQKIGNGPVVTRYPIPGPVVTKFAPPPQAMPYDGTLRPQAQYAPQYPSQPLAPAHNFHQPQPSYAPQGYAPQPQYGQYGQYPPTSQAQAMPYGIGAMAQYAPTPYQYGHAAPQPQCQQQSHFAGYNVPATGHFLQPPENQYQQNMPYAQPQVGYQQPQPYPAQNYAPRYNGMGPVQSGPGSFSPTQQYDPGAPPHYPYQPNPVVPQGYPGAQGQSFRRPSQHYPHELPQQWQHSRTPSFSKPAPGPPRGYTATTPDSTPKIAAIGPITTNGSGLGAPEHSKTQAESTFDDGQSQNTAAEDSTFETEEGCVRPPFRATPIDWPFDIDWEESIKDYKYSVSVRAVPISTPITLKHSEFPNLCKSGSTQVIGKYVGPHAFNDFVRPIKDSRHWALFQDDPAFAEIDESLPEILEEDWVEYQQARQAHFGSQENSPSPEITRRTIEEVQPQELLQEHSNGRVGAHGGPSHREDRRSHSRSRSRTPNVRGGGTPGAYEADAADDTWAPRGSASRQVTPQLDDHKEALLASLGVSGLPKPFEAGDPQGPRNMRVAPGGPSRQDSGYLSGRPSVSSGPDTDASKSDGGRGMSWSAQNLPRPPPPGGPRGYGNIGSRGQSPAYSSNNSRASSRNQSRSASANPEESPLSPTSAALLGLGAAEGETNGRKRRQGDDHYVRKRPQPRVDAAFSRRW